MRLSGDLAFGREVFGAVRRGMDWIIEQRDADPTGLLPITYVSDNEHTEGRLAGDNFWAVAGVESAVDLARRLGETALATRWAAELTALRASLRTALDAATARTSGGAVPPALDRPGGQDFGNFALTYPTGAVPARLAGGRRDAAAGAGGLQRGARDLPLRGPRAPPRAAQLPRLGDPARARRPALGRQGPLRRARARHDDARRLGARQRAPRRSNLTPNGWWAAELVTLVRNMLVREEGDGLVLLSAIPPRWLRPGAKPTVVESAPTGFGPVSVTLRPLRGGAELRWRAPKGVALRWPVPIWVRDVRGARLSADRRSIVLPASGSGRLRVRWTLRSTASPEPAYARAVSVLRNKYGDGDGAGGGGGSLPGDA